MGHGEPTWAERDTERWHHLIAVLADHLEDLAFPHGKPGHGAKCECKECEAWGDLQHARLAINHPKAPTIETNPYRL